MMWTIPNLSGSAPLLKPAESILVKVEQVGLYDGDQKSVEHANGTLYVTNVRLIYVDEALPRRHSVQIMRDQIAQFEYTSKFLRTSAKIALKIREAAPTARTWVCEICSFPNVGGNVCSTCGVKATHPIPTVSQSAEKGICPTCTFKNHNSLAFCEVCGAQLKSENVADLGNDVKLSFRSGHSHEVLEALEIREVAGTEVSSSVSAPDPGGSGVGFERLKKSQEQANKEIIATLEELNVQLSRGNKEEVSRLLPEAASIAQRFSLPPKIPVTVGGNSPSSLARQISDLLVGKDVLEKCGGMLTLHDLFVVINRSRGIGLITPQQLVDALELCEPLDLAIRCRTLGERGVKVVEVRSARDQNLQRLVRYITQESEIPWKAASGFSARDISERFGYSVQIAAAELELAEQKGRLCRDEHTSGLRFFVNQIKPT